MEEEEKEEEEEEEEERGTEICILLRLYQDTL